MNKTTITFATVITIAAFATGLKLDSSLQSNAVTVNTPDASIEVSLTERTNDPSCSPRYDFAINDGTVRTMCGKEMIEMFANEGDDRGDDLGTRALRAYIKKELESETIDEFIQNNL